jgi:hypothetical protein
MLITFLYIIFLKKNPQLSLGSCQKMRFYKKIRKKNINNVFVYKFKKKLSLFSIKVHAKRCVPTKKNKKKNINNVLVYKIKKNSSSTITFRFMLKDVFLQKKK